MWILLEKKHEGAIMTIASSVSAQTTVKGNVVNERGESIEYVSIGFENDSVGVISDAKGHFVLTIPAGRKRELSFSHVSYLTTEIPYEEYSKSDELTVVLKDKVVELAEVVIGKKNKPKTDYYVSIRVVDGFGEKGFLYLNAYMKNGLYRNAVKGKTKKLPVCPAIQVKGYEVE